MRDMADDPIVRAYALTEDLPAVETARLPVSYEQAKAALQRAQSIDECKDWADKAQAIASYARQAGDVTLQETAQRIRDRAIKRVGELLREIKASQGKRTDLQLGSPGGPMSLTRGQIAESAGLTPKQQKTALRVAAVPDDEFDAAVDRPGPATVKELARMGTKPAPKPVIDLGDRDPKDYATATEAMAYLADMAGFAKKAKPVTVAAGLKPHERERVRGHAEITMAWVSELIAELERGHA
jgi:hypothetical protein